MADTTFVASITKILASWLNAINDHVYNDTPGSGSYTHNASGIQYDPAGTGAIAETEQSRGRWTVLATDYLSVADRALVRAGTTVALDTALDAAMDYLTTLGGGKVRIPAGNYSLNNFRPQTDIEVEGDGYEATIINQAAAGNPAYYALSDVTTGQLVGITFKNLKVVGHATATVPAVKVAATTPYVVTKSDFDYNASSTYNALEIVVTAASEVYLCKFKVHSSSTSNTAFITEGVYNTYDLTADGCAVGAIVDGSLQSTFVRAVTDGRQTYNGQNNTLVTPTVETIFGTTGDYAIGTFGNNHVVINPVVSSVDPTDSVAAFSLGNAGNTFIQPRVSGAVYPAYSFDLTGVPTAVTIIGGNILTTNKLEAHATAVQLANVTFIGDVSSFYTGLSTIQSVNTTAVGNTAGGEDDLMTYTLPANVLSSNGRGVEITAWGKVENNSNPKTIKLYFGSTAIMTQALTISQTGYWKISAEVFRRSEDVQDYIAQLNQGGTTTLVDVESGSLTENDGATIPIKCTGTVTDGGGGINNNDIANWGLFVRVVR